jgi:hypothetical protein
VKVGIETGVGSPKSDSSLVGREVSIGNTDESVLTGGGVEAFGYVRDVIGSVEGDDERKQFAAECWSDERKGKKYGEAREVFHSVLENDE